MSNIGNSPGNASQRVVTRKTATAGQTDFASDSGYATGYVDVVINGSDLVAGVGFIELGDGINIRLSEACEDGDTVKIVAWIPRGLSDGYLKSETNALLALKADLVSGKIPSSQLPAYVDDVLEYANLAAFPATGSTGIIYVAQDTNNCYRWSGSVYIVLTDLSAYYTKTQADAKYVGKTGDSGALLLPSGTTAQRPTNPADGYTRYNTERKLIEYYDSSIPSWVGIGSFTATGGIIYQSGGYSYHVFTSSSTIQVIQGSRQADILVVAGGGSGGGAGGSDGAGGGGAGGLVYSTSVNLNIGLYSVVIGAGGAGVGSFLNGIQGGNSYISGLSLTTAIGGGYASAESDSRNAGNGGSGGGGGGYQSTNLGGSGTSGQGNNGANAQTVNGGGGGGGAGSAASGKNAGNGLQYSTFASATSTGANGGYYAGGGSGSGDGRGSTTGGAAGLGGGGTGASASSNSSPTGGTVNTGGGGGGSAGSTWVGSAKTSGNGGSGIVIVRYLTP